MTRRAAVGLAGERLAAAFLESHGLRVVARNVEVEGGEVDIVATDGRSRIVVEVRTITGDGEPLDAYGPVKAYKVGRLARILRADRVDLVAVRLSREAAELRWVRGAA